MTQRNAALVEQLNTALTQTESQAAELDMVVTSFVVGPRMPEPVDPIRIGYAA